MTPRLAPLVALALGCALTLPASARSFRVTQIPNGTVESCNTCHTAGGGSPLNDFGTDVGGSLDGTNADWSAVYDLDSDTDGYTNGEELGDPDGDGTPIPGWNVTAPGLSDSTPDCRTTEDCDGGEVCDLGVCVTGDCVDDDDCTDGQSCIDNVCTDDEPEDTDAPEDTDEPEDTDDGGGPGDTEERRCSVIAAPTTLALFGIGAIGALLRRRRDQAPEAG